MRYAIVKTTSKKAGIIGRILSVLRDMQSWIWKLERQEADAVYLPHDRQSILGLLLRAAEKRATQTRFAPNGRVAVNDAALGCFIDGGDQRANLIHIRFFRRAHLLMHRAHARNRAAVAERTLQCLARAFGGGFRVGHFDR